MKSTALFVPLILLAAASAANARLIACVGASITYGSGISDRLRDGYPAQLERMLKEFDPAWEVEKKKGSKP